MTTGRKRLTWILTLCLLLLSAGGIIRHQWQQLLHGQGVERLDWMGLDLSLRGFSLRQLSLRQRNDAGTLTIAAEGIRLSLPGLLRPLPPDALHIARLDLDWRPAPETTDAPAPFEPPSRQQLEDWLERAPRTVTVEHFDLTLPCASGRCREQGSLAWRHAGRAPFTANLALRLHRAPHTLALTASASGSLEQADLDLQLALDNQPRLFSRHRLSRESQTSQWSGTLAMGSLPEAPWLLDWLARWLPQQPPPLLAPPKDMRLGASWALQLPGNDWSDLHGDFAASLHLPVPWPVIGLGQLQGRLDLAAHRQTEGLWQPGTLTADLQLQPTPERLDALPPALRPGRIHLRLAPAEEDVPPGAPLPLQLALETEGGMALHLEAPRLLLDTRAFSLSFDEARLGLRGRSLSMAGVQLGQPRADLRLGGQVGAERLSLRALPGSSLQWATLVLADLPELSVQASRSTLAGLTLEAARRPDGTMTFALAGPLRLEVGRAQHPQLRPQSWQWQGRLDTDLERLRLDGRLSNASELQLSTRLSRTPAGHLSVAAAMPEHFLRAGNPFARTFSAWPALLELNTGRLALNATLGLSPGDTPDLRLEVQGRGIGGIHDRIELSGLDAHLALTLHNRQLRLDPLEVRLAQANPGFVFGPLEFHGRYQAPATQPARGRLDWREARIAALGGRLFAEPGELDLSAPRLRLPLRLEGLDLRQLLIAYPAQGLEGSGIIDGHFELQHGPDGPSIDNGSLAARAPGGILRFDSPRVRALGQSNPAMRLVTEALENFHYELLASDVRYDVDGTLRLGLRLHGRNPALENGRPIHFNINLEEDIPALLTSLQLSDRVSETIRRRVQERLQSGGTPSPP